MSDDLRREVELLKVKVKTLEERLRYLESRQATYSLSWREYQTAYSAEALPVVISAIIIGFFLFLFFMIATLIK